MCSRTVAALAQKNYFWHFSFISIYKSPLSFLNFPCACGSWTGCRLANVGMAMMMSLDQVPINDRSPSAGDVWHYTMTKNPKLSSASELEMTITECYCCQCVVFVLMHWLIVQAQQYYLSGKILHQSCSDFYEFWTENYMIIQIDSPGSQKGKQENLSHTVRRYTQDKICMDYSLLGPRATSHMRVHLCGGRASAFLSRKLAHALSICN